MDNTYDVLVAGCGPGGSSAAAYLSLAGKRVLVLEKEIFPRFHIGESLLPHNLAIFRDLGVLPAIEAAGFPRKLAARFCLGNGFPSTRFVFRRGKFSPEAGSFSVERAVFDHILLKHARVCGADVREGWTVSKTAADDGGVNVQALDPEGKTHAFRASFLIDATGRANFTGRRACG
jgi:FADH2-dependent halogenase